MIVLDWKASQGYWTANVVDSLGRYLDIYVDKYVSQNTVIYEIQVWSNDINSGLLIHNKDIRFNTAEEAMNWVSVALMTGAL